MSWKQAAVLTLALTSLCSPNPASPGNPSTRSTDLPKSADKLNWVRYTDPAEGAFSMDVPVGWQVQGGMYRFGYFDVRWMMDVRSLDGKIVLRMDDVSVPPYALPGPNTGREGQPYNKPQQFQMMIEGYREGPSYAELYAKRRFSGVCRSLNPGEPGWAPTMPVAWRNGAASKSTDGSVAYDCDTDDGPRIVFVYARTNLYSSTGLWVADPVLSVIAAPDDARLAYSMAQHMMDSWQKNPQWEQYQNQITQMGLDRIRAGFQQFMQQMQAYDQARTSAMNQQVAGFESRQNAQAQQVSSWGETLTGLQTVSDPMTGSPFQVFTGPKANYYTNGNGVTLNSNVSPGPAFHELTPVEH